MKIEKTVRVFFVERYDGEWPPEGAAAFISWFQSKIESIPSEHRAAAKIEIDSVGGYEGAHYPSLEITYQRLETDEEENNRLAADDHRRKAEQARELETLAKLQAKYPNRS